MEEIKYFSDLQERQGDPEEIKVGQPHLVPGMVKKQQTLETISRHMNEKKIIRNNQHGSWIITEANDQPDKLL